MAKIDLPNQAGVPSTSNLTGEWVKYNELYLDIDRTTSGQLIFTSTTSGEIYDTSNYSSDTDVYNKGEDGMANLLKKYVLADSLFLAEDANAKLDKSGDELETYTEKVEVSTGVSGTKNLNLGAYRVFDVSVIGTTTFTFTNIPSSGTAVSWTLILHQDSTGRAITLPTSVEFPNGDSVPNFTTANETSILSFYSVDGGVIVYASSGVGYQV